MNYQEFQSNIQSALTLKLGSNVSISLQDIAKNNDTHLNGITIAEKGFNISPTIYLNSYYDQYLSGRSLEDIYSDILTVYKENRPTKNIDVSFFTRYEEVQHKIIYKLVNYKKNNALLQHVPHYEYLDLAIVFCCLVEATERGTATILIRDHHLSYWGIQKEDLFPLACKNTPALLPFEIRSMSSVLAELFRQMDAPFPPMEELPAAYPMYVLSNSHKLHGSSCILYQNLLADFSEKLGADLYILPSSIHEVLILPVTEGTAADELSHMVEEVNSTQLAADEILSDHAYYYSRETNELSCC